MSLLMTLLHWAALSLALLLGLACAVGHAEGGAPQKKARSKENKG